MFSLNEGNSFKVYTQGADLRKGLDGLCGIVRKSTLSPTNGDVYVFLNKTRTTMKLLHWDKRMESGRVSHKIFSADEIGFRTIRWDEIVLFIEGISPKTKRRKRYNL